VHAEHVHNLAPAFFASAARHLFSLGAAHQRDEILAQLASGHGVDGVVDGFVAFR